ncbi:MAG: SEL1-like repeat protein [Alphaproteobacteria bacterium]|nr:SEL1-like repeat protein [Alphaproteobacteria bacterium]
MNRALVGAVLVAAMATISWDAEACSLSARPTLTKPEYSDEKLALAHKGDAQAMFEVAAGYREGRGVSIDYAKAYKWFNVAAERNGEARRLRDELKHCLTQAEVLEAEADSLLILMSARQ